MRNSVLKGSIPIRVEHENKFYSDIGVWKEAEILSDNRLYVKGEIDLELSMARDLEVLLRKGVKICMSVGGRVVDAISEFVDKAQTWVTTYTDIELYEISIVKNPANPETNLAISKSFDAKTKQETEIAKSIGESAKELIKLEETMTTKTAKNIPDLVKSLQDEIKKDWGETSCEIEQYNYQLTKEDLKFIATYIEALNKFKDEKYTWEEADAIYTEIFNIEQDNGGYLPDECYVIELLPSHYFPHHNADFTINEKWLNFWLYKLLNGSYGYLSPKEYRLALSHLWMHFKMISLGNQTKSTEVKENILEKQRDESEITALLKSCYDFKVLKAGTRPQVDGNDLSDKEISKMANAYKAVNERFRSTQTTASIAKSFYSLNNNNMSIVEKAKADAQAEATTAVEATATAEATTETATTEVATEVATEVTPAPVAGVGVTEKSETPTDGAEDVTKTEEAGTDASLNNTGSEETSEEVTKSEETTTVETTPVVEETAEVTPEVTKSEETPEATTVETSETSTEETPTEDTLAKANDFTMKAIADALQPIQSLLASLQKSLEERDSLMKSKDETANKNNEMLVKSLETMAKSYTELKGQVSAMNTSVAFRKSQAVTIEKSQGAEGEDLSTPESFNKAISAEMDVNGGNYAKARNTVLARLTSQA